MTPSGFSAITRGREKNLENVDNFREGRAANVGENFA